MFECNLDVRQRILRLAFGILLLVLGFKSMGYGYPLYVPMGLSLGGAFVLFEGARGWCALKALGLKIPF